MMDTIKKAFNFKGDRPLIVCLGNEFRNDDGVGPYIASRINNKGIPLINAGEVFENYLTEIINYRPTDIVIIDAALFGGSVGDVEILDEKKLATSKIISTHSLPVTALIDIIRADVKDVNITILGIQVYDTGFGQKISDEVRSSADAIVEFINNLKLNG